MDQYAVFGNPISHSKSPYIHTMFATQTEQQLSYFIVEPAKDEFSQAIKQFFVEGGKGANVTAPFKLDAYNFADELSDRARLAGSVNTLMLCNDGSVFGDTTDGQGLVDDLHRQFGDLSGLNVLMLGAGGAARAVVGSLFEAGVSKLCIANRTIAKAQELAATYAAFGDIHAFALTEIPLGAFDLIINSTSSSMSGDLPELDPKVFAKTHYVYDMAYKDQLTRFLVWALQHKPSVKVSDGLGMLVGQAAESFFIWRGIKPNITPIISNLRAQL